MATIELTADNFEKIVNDNEIVLIDFWAEWCGPCKMFGPIFESASSRHADVVFAKCDTETQQELAMSFEIRSIPTLAAFRQGILLAMQPGVVPEEALDSLVTQLKGLDMDQVRKEIEEHEHEHQHGPDCKH